MIVADTGAVIALVDRDDRYHHPLLELYKQHPTDWVFPWAILPEVDYLLATHVGENARDTFLGDLSSENLTVEWGDYGDLPRAEELHNRYRALALGLVDGVVMAVAERLGADAIATLDIRHFGAVELSGNPLLVPRDL